MLRQTGSRRKKIKEIIMIDASLIGLDYILGIINPDGKIVPAKSTTARGVIATAN